MPYLLDYARRVSLISGDITPQDGADLNFLLCHMVDQFIEAHGLSYHTLEEIDGAFDLARLEFVRRIVGPYEDVKCAQNGDVFTHTAPLLQQMTDLLTAAGLPTLPSDE